MLGTMQTLVYIALEVEYEEFLRDKKEGLKIYSKFSMKSVKTRKKEKGRKGKKEGQSRENGEKDERKMLCLPLAVYKLHPFTDGLGWLRAWAENPCRSEPRDK